jgi:PTH1 family peptidyl-tRNA hydrolase
VKLIVGLGNPGREYENTRHNVGFIVVDGYLGNVDWHSKFKGLYHEDKIGNEKVIFLKPQTFMNLSGDSVVEFANFYKLDPADIFVIHDDMDIEFGSYKLKINSSDGGHNGIKSIINRLGSNGFARLKVGISHNKLFSTKDYVLGKFSKEEKDVLNNNQSDFNKIIESFVIDGIDKTMNIYNTKK